MTETSTLFDRVGGRPFFEELTRRFYDGVATDPTLRPLYPSDEAGFEAARLHLELFLVQYWGGPGTYNELRGAPRLRMRHAPFLIGPAERDAWLRHMTGAVRQAGMSPLDEVQLLGYLTTSAEHLMNHPA